MKLAVVGTRTFNDYKKLEQKIAELAVFHDIERIVTGDAPGADALALRWAKKNGYPFTKYVADWNQFGKAAGPMRNQIIVNNADMLLAFWDGVSTGTADSIKKAKKKGIKVEIMRI